MTRVNIEAEVRERMSTFISAGRVVRATWLTHAVVGGHPIPDFEDTEWYRTCAYGHVRDLVRSALRSLKPTAETDEQLAFPGFKHIQRAYNVVRKGEPCAVPTEQLTAEEIDAKVLELKTMAVGCVEHAKELERFRAQRFGTAQVTA